MIGIVVSRADEASEAIWRALRDHGSWTEQTDNTRPDADGGGTVYHSDTDPPLTVRTFDTLHIALETPDEAFENPTALVFASRHSGDTGPLLTCHHTGNFGPAEYGGQDRSFAPAAPGIQRALLAGFAEHAPDSYDVGIECTHHGPTALTTPSIFAELGSTEAEWSDSDGATAVARAIYELPARDGTPAVRSTAEASSTDENATAADDHQPRHALAIGGGHYAPRVERLIRETAWGIGHVASDWQLDELGDPAAHADTLARAADASDAAVAVSVGTYPAVREALRQQNVRVVGERWLREVDDRSFELVERLESEVTTVNDGLRFGERRTTEYTVRPLPGRLTETAFSVDNEATRQAVQRETVAYETDENGTRPTDTAAVAVGRYDPLIDALASVLEARYDTVERTPEAVETTRTVFDPEAARTLGIPEGPAFGRLANGQPVEVDGRQISPETVQTTDTERFPVPD